MGAQTVLDGEDAVRAAVGMSLGTSEWFEITPARIDDYIAATGDPTRAYFAVSLSNMFLPQIVEVRGYSLGVNYGTQAVQLGAPLRAGDRVRGRASLVEVADVRDGIQTTMVITIERDGERDAPGPDDAETCVIESLSRWLNPAPPTASTGA
ncbi:MAG: acyl dehydratase [Ilumatobacteraceae bacterium]|nr:acyl dehydratase [Ilumatobacteraceae bacterium]